MAKAPFVADVMRSRRVCRSFAPTPLPEGWLDHAIIDAERAPTAGATAVRRLRVVDVAGGNEAFWQAAWPTRDRTNDPERFAAPAIVVAVADRGAYEQRYARVDKQIVDGAGNVQSAIDRWPTDFSITDAAFAAYGLLLLAEADGIGAWFFGVDGSAVSALLELPLGMVVIGAVALGYAAVGYAADQDRLNHMSS